MMTENHDLSLLCQRLDYSFKNLELLQTALTHRSYHFENRATSHGHFERLEFLGDAVLDLLLSELLMERFPDVEEGVLSKWRASLVNEIALGEIARNMNLGSFLFIGKSERNNREEARPRLLASAFEALLAALYQDGGLDVVRHLIKREFGSRMDSLSMDNQFAADFKTRLQEWAQKNLKTVPEYKLLYSEGPEHAKTFRYGVWLGDRPMGEGTGLSRKAAEQEAARVALEGVEK